MEKVPVAPSAPSPTSARDNASLHAFVESYSRPISNARGSAFTELFRRALLAAHGHRCTYCGGYLDAETMRVDHVIPRFNGGATEVTNVVAACDYCNSAKCAGDLENLRWILAVRDSKVFGVILPNQARALVGLGIDLGISPYIFQFEREQERGAA